MGHLHGQLRQRRRLLPLQLLRHPRLRQDRTGRHLRAGLPAYRRSAHVRHLPIAEEDEAHKDYKDVVQEVEGFCFMANACIGNRISGFEHFTFCTNRNYRAKHCDLLKSTIASFTTTFVRNILFSIVTRARLLTAQLRRGQTS